jgi:hypothetical protein
MTVALHTPEAQTLIASVRERVRLRTEGDHLRGRWSGPQTRRRRA